jgi:AraC-like DNA-binding protein
MAAVPLVRRTIFSQCAATLESRGVSTEKALAKAGLRNWQYGDPEDWIPFQDAVRVFEVGAGLVGEPNFGLMVGDDHEFDEFGVYGLTVSHSVSVYHAIHKFCDLINQFNTVAKYWVQESRDNIWICRAEPPGMADDIWQMEKFTVRAMIHAVQLGAGSEWRPREVHFCGHDTESLRDTELFDGAIIRSGQPCSAVAVPRKLLSYPLIANRALSQSLGDEKAADAAASQTFAESVKTIIESILPDSVPNMDLICDVTDLSRRNLQRELKKENATYRDIVDQVRYVKATTMLHDPDVPLRDIAFQLKYANESHFIRAFRRWSGVTPGEYRQHGLT